MTAQTNMRPGRKPVRVTGQSIAECPECEGMGYTVATCTETRTRGPNGKLYTHRQGSGCPKCHGTGQRECVIAPLKSFRSAEPAELREMTWDVYADPSSVNHYPGFGESTR